MAVIYFLNNKCIWYKDQGEFHRVLNMVYANAYEEDFNDSDYELYRSACGKSFPMRAHILPETGSWEDALETGKEPCKVCFEYE